MLKSAVRAAVLVLAALTAGQAAAKDIARMSFAVETQGEDPYRRGAGTITVSDDGVAVVDVRMFGGSGSPAVTQTVRQLAPAVAAALNYRIQALSNEELKTTHQDFVCMMMPWPGSNRDLFVARGFDSDSGVFAGELTLTLTQRGCWSHEHVAPLESYAVNMAEVLAAQLEILGISFAAE